MLPLFFKRCLIGYLLVFAFGSGFSQNRKTITQTIPLRTALQLLKEYYKVSFTYSDAAIANIFVEKPDYSRSLTSTITALSKQTPFTYTPTNTNTYILSPESEVLNPAATSLNTVLLKSYLTKGIIQQTNGSQTIDYTDFGILPGLIEPDVLQTIQALPGIQSINENIADINIRGGTNDQNLILWDGIKMYQSGHFFGLVTAFNPYLTTTATVSKNGTSARFGDGVSGVITIATNDSLPESSRASIGSNLINADLYAAIPLGKKLGLRLASRKSYSELYKSITYTNYFDQRFQNTEVATALTDAQRDLSKFSFYDVNAQLIYKPGKSTYLKANVLRIANRLRFQERSLNDTIGLRESSAAQSSFSANIKFEQKWNTDWRVQFQGYFTNYELNARNENVEDQQRLIQLNDIKETAAKLQTTYTGWNNFIWRAGYDFVETGILNTQDVNNPIVRTARKEVLRVHGLYLESNFLSDRTPSTSFTVGIRTQYFEDFGKFRLEPRLSFRQNITSRFAFVAAAEAKSQTTTQTITVQNDFLGIENRRWLLANESTIPILTNQQASAGLQLQTKGWLLSAEGYLKYVDGITSQSQRFQNQFQFTQTVGAYHVRGLDFLLNKRFHNINSWLSYSLAKNTYDFPELEPTRFHNVIDIRHTVTSGVSYTLTNLKLSAGLNWRSGKPFTRPLLENQNTEGAILYSEPNERSISDFLRLDISVLYNRQLSKKLRLYAGVSVLNATDKDNIINSYFNRTTDGEITRINQRGLPFTPNATLRLDFD